MLDIKLIRQNPNEIASKLKTKDEKISIEEVLQIDEKVRSLQTGSEKEKSRLNSLSRAIGEKKQKNEEASSLLKEVEQIKQNIQKLEENLKPLEEKRTALLSFLPNIPFDDVPISLNPQDNVCLKTYLERPKFDFKFKNHIELNETLKLFDFERAAKIARNRFPMYTDLGAKLEWALINYMLEHHLKRGYTQIIPPLLVSENIMYGSGQLPKFKDQQFHIKDEEYDLYLVPTAEVALNGMHSEEIFEEEALPTRYVAYTPCFRREAGAAGKQERGLIRTHQFNKVEMFCFTHPDDSKRIFEEMLKSIEEILQGLNLHYRDMLLVTGDMSFASAKTIDVEVWLPGQDRYYEVSSLSNCTDYQARRSSIRFRSKEKKVNFVHTLNGSGLATSRLMAAILENNQQKDGSVVIPEVLRKYLGGEKGCFP